MKQWLKRNDIGVGSVMAFVVVPFVSALATALDKVDAVSLTTDQLWGFAKAAFVSVLAGIAGRYWQAYGVKRNAFNSVLSPAPEDEAVPEIPEGLV